MVDRQLWETVVKSVESGSINGDYVMGYLFEVIGNAVDEAETCAKHGEKSEAVHKLRELQALCEKAVGILAPEQKGRPRLVAAA